MNKQFLFATALFLLSAAVKAQQTVTKNQTVFGCDVKIKSAYSNKIAQVGYASRDNGALIYTFSDGDYTHFKWQITDAGNGYVKFKNQNSGKFLAVHGGLPAPGTPILQHDDNGGREFLWQLKWITDNSFKLINAKSGKPMAIEGGSRGDAKILQWDDNNQGDIVWQLVTLPGCDNNIQSGTATRNIEVVLHTISVSEATRNRIDNGDCKRVFGQVIVELWEADNNGNPVREFRAQGNASSLIFEEKKHDAPNPIANEYYNSSDLVNSMTTGRITYTIPETFVNNQRLVLKVKTTLGCRHKDNDFASYDYLAMKEERVEIINLNGNNMKQSRQELPSKGMFEYMYSTEANRTSPELPFLNFYFPQSLLLPRPDDSHKLWIHFSVLKAASQSN